MNLSVIIMCRVVCIVCQIFDHFDLKLRKSVQRESYAGYDNEKNGNKCDGLLVWLENRIFESDFNK